MVAFDTAILVLIVAIFVDCSLGEYPSKLHPVVWIGTSIDFSYGWLDQRSPALQRGLGWILPVFLITAWVALVGLWINAIDQSWWQFFWTVFFVKASFALKALGQAHHRVKAALRKKLTPLAKQELRWLCSRDPSELSTEDIGHSSIASIAENLVDSVVAPLCFYLLAGVYGAIAYRVVNTLDAMVGYQDHRRWYGEGAARLDDIANFLPARLTAGLLLLVGLSKGFAYQQGFTMLRRDRRLTPSPNGGWPMATTAGLLEIKLSKRGVYQLGESTSKWPLDRQMDRAWHLISRAAWCFYLICLLSLASLL